MAAQTWDLFLVLSTVSAAGLGSNTSSGSGNAEALLQQTWDILLVSSVLSPTGIGSNTSSGVGHAETHEPTIEQTWPLILAENIISIGGAGSNLSESGMFNLYVVLYTWWVIQGTRPVLYHYTHDFPAQTLTHNQTLSQITIKLARTSTPIQIKLSKSLPKLYIKTRMVDGVKQFTF